MPRNSGGTYSLPAGNPVVTATVISSSWANTTMTDLKNAMTDSLSRSGQGGMSAQLALFAGTIGAPGLSWGLEATSGLYRAGAGDFRYAIGGIDVFNIVGTGPLISNANPLIRLNETDAAANNRAWEFDVQAEQLRFRVADDARSAFVSWLAVDRTLNVVDTIALFATSTSISNTAGSPSLTAPTLALTSTTTVSLQYGNSSGGANSKFWDFNISTTTLSGRTMDDARTTPVSWVDVVRAANVITSVNFPNGTLQYGGNEVGFRNYVNGGVFSGNTAAGTGDRGGLFRYTGGGGNNFTVPNFGIGGMFTLVNEGTGTLNVIGSGVTLTWFNGGGALTTGSRVLAIGGVLNATMIAAASAYVWGTGIS